jgi:hypothetical protein
MKSIIMGSKCWVKTVGVFCISCSSLLAHVEEGDVGEGAPEAVAVPMRLVSDGIDDMESLLDLGVAGALDFTRRWAGDILIWERLDLPPEERQGIENIWDHCLTGFAAVREVLAECMEKLDAMVILAQAVRALSNGRPDHVEEAQQNYEEIRDRHRQQYMDFLRQSRAWFCSRCGIAYGL